MSALAKLAEILEAPPEEDADPKRARLAAALRQTEPEIANLTAAIASGDAPDALVAALRAREREAKTAATELRAMDVPVARVEDAEVRAEALKLLDDWRVAPAALAGGATGTCEVAGRRARDVLSDGDGYELGAVPSVEKLLTSVPASRKAGIPVRRCVIG